MGGKDLTGRFVIPDGRGVRFGDQSTLSSSFIRFPSLRPKSVRSVLRLVFVYPTPDGPVVHPRAASFLLSFQWAMARKSQPCQSPRWCSSMDLFIASMVASQSPSRYWTTSSVFQWGGNWCRFSFRENSCSFHFWGGKLTRRGFPRNDSDARNKKLDTRPDSAKPPVLGCPECGHQQIAYNSCGNRHCPTCQATAAARWLEAPPRSCCRGRTSTSSSRCRMSSTRSPWRIPGSSTT